MADGGSQFELNPAQQNEAAVNFEMDRQKSMQASDENSEGDLLKGDLGNTNIASRSASSRAQTEVPQEEQGRIGVSMSAARQRQDQNRKTETKLSASSGAGVEGGGKLFNGMITHIIKKIPGISMMLRAFEQGGLKQKINILRLMKFVLEIARKSAAITYAVIQWIEIFPPLVIPTFGLILIIGIPAAILMPLFYAIFNVGPVAKTIGKAIKMIDKASLALKKLFQQEQQRKAATASLS
ncbi:MAG: hypothetical protein AAB467_02005, partial [Patescibacteria group bacterium]